MSRRVRARLLAVPLVALAAGCGAAALPTRYPSKPPAGMSAGSAQAEQQACIDAAARAAVERAWAYIGCMVSKGHTVGVAFHVHAAPTHLYVVQTRPHDARTASLELEECRKSAYAAVQSERGKARDVLVDRMESVFGTCVEPRGYRVQGRA